MMAEDPTPVCEVIVFSRDRALQLHALLTSYYDNVRPHLPVHVIYTACNPAHRQSYETVMSCFPRVHFIKEGLFREDLIDLMTSLDARAVLFLVDDMVFVNDVNFAEMCAVDLLETVPTLRLGRTVGKNYPWQCMQRLPTLQNKGDGFLHFLWQQGELDWHYPLSLDGHIFQCAELMELTRDLEFHSPNTYEGALQKYQPFFVVREGICYPQPRAFSIPWNRVQEDYENNCGQLDIELLLERWTSGYQLDTKRLHGLKVEAAHQEVPPTFIRRTGAE